MSRAIEFDRAICLEITRRLLTDNREMCQNVERLADSPTGLMKDRFPFEKISYWLLYRTAEYCLRAIMFLIPRVPHRLLVLMTSATVRLTFAILWPYRKLMEENISMAMDDEFLTVERRKTLARTAWRNFV